MTNRRLSVAQIQETHVTDIFLPQLELLSLNDAEVNKCNTTLPEKSEEYRLFKLKRRKSNVLRNKIGKNYLKNKLEGFYFIRRSRRILGLLPEAFEITGSLLKNVKVSSEQTSAQVADTLPIVRRKPFKRTIHDVLDLPYYSK